MSAAPGRGISEPLVAPMWHTGALVALIVAVAVVGSILTALGGQGAASAAAGPRWLTGYLPMIVVQIGLAVYVTRVARPPGTARAMVGRSSPGVRGRAADVAVAAAGAAAIVGIELAWSALTHSGANQRVLAALPHTLLERAAWVLVAVVVGVSEELVYRGYLQRQLAAFTRSDALGWALQAALFGVAHLEQGGAAAARVAVYGLVLGATVRARRSLVPAMLAHVAIDLASGLAR
jgi:membrane protease YdiL (CAAX protease family)